LAENIVSEVEDRLSDLFGDDGEDVPQVEEVAEDEGAPDFGDVRSEIEDAPILEEDSEDAEDSPLRELKSVVLSIDWEISDKIMSRFLEHVEGLKDEFKDDRIIQMFLQLLTSVGKYIKAKKEDSDPDVVRLLNSAYAGLEKVVLGKEITEGEKKKLIVSEINKFKKIREKLGGKPEAAPKKQESPPKEQTVTEEPEKEISKPKSKKAKAKTRKPESKVVEGEAAAIVFTGKPKGLGLGVKMNLIMLLPLIIVAVAGYIYICQPTGITHQIDQMVQTYAGVSAENARHIVIAVLYGLIILIGFFASVYVSRLAGKLRHLTEVVEHIGAGEETPVIKVKSGGEVGTLAGAIGRLQKQ